MGSTWVLSAPDGPHVGPMNLAIKDGEGIVYEISCTIIPYPIRTSLIPASRLQSPVYHV